MIIKSLQRTNFTVTTFALRGKTAASKICSLRRALCSLEPMFMWFKKTKKNEEEFLWHSPTASFTDFDDSKIGKVSNKYGWGIYFSTEKNNARSHNNSIDHIYKFPKSKLDGKSFIYYSKSIKKHDDPHVISVAKAFYNDRFDDEEFDVGGHRFYEDIVEGMNNKGEASRFLVQQGISGGLIKEPSEVSVLLYDTSLWDHAVKVPL